jgi:hypothetical protein
VLMLRKEIAVAFCANHASALCGQNADCLKNIVNSSLPQNNCVCTVTQLPSSMSRLVYSAYETVNSIFLYLDHDYLTFGLSVTGLARVYCILQIHCCGNLTYHIRNFRSFRRVMLELSSTP